MILLSVISLALIRQESIVSSFSDIKANAIKMYGDYFNKFFEYFLNFWLYKVGTEAFCAFKDLNRTSTFEMDYHRRMYARIKYSSLTLWHYLGKQFDKFHLCKIILMIYIYIIYVIFISVNILGNSLSFSHLSHRDYESCQLKQLTKISFFDDVKLTRFWVVLENQPNRFHPREVITKASYKLEKRKIFDIVQQGNDFFYACNC